LQVLVIAVASALLLGGCGGAGHETAAAPAQSADSKAARHPGFGDGEGQDRRDPDRQPGGKTAEHPDPAADGDASAAEVAEPGSAGPDPNQGSGAAAAGEDAGARPTEAETQVGERDEGATGGQSGPPDAEAQVEHPAAAGGGGSSPTDAQEAAGSG
jgi:hypothetical protein